MASSKSSNPAQDVAPSAPAPEPSEQVPEPKPEPAERKAPHLAAGVVADIKANGWAVDPFTGKTLTTDDVPASLLDRA